jgi:hypothetical protein
MAAPSEIRATKKPPEGRLVAHVGDDVRYEIRMIATMLGRAAAITPAIVPRRRAKRQRQARSTRVLVQNPVC